MTAEITAHSTQQHISNAHTGNTPQNIPYSGTCPHSGCPPSTFLLAHCKSHPQSFSDACKVWGRVSLQAGDETVTS